MTRSVRLVLPYPPSANRYWRVFRGRATPSAEGKAYKEEVAVLCLLAFRSQPLSGPVRVKAHVFRPPTFIANAQNRDLDNNPKVLKDALQGTVYVNDSQTFRMEFEHWDVPAGEERVQLEVVEDFAPRPLPERWPLDAFYADAFAGARQRLASVRGEVREQEKRRRKARKAEQPKSLATPAYRPPRKARGLP